MTSSTSSTQGATTDAIDDGTPLMPAAFFGHGNPMNAISDNRYTAAWRAHSGGPSHGHGRFL